MKKFEIVKEHWEFDNIIASGNCLKNKYFNIYNKESKKSFPRFGIAVGKKIGNAVIRNHLKRQMRIIIDQNKNVFPKSQDYIIIVKRSCLDATFQDLLKAFRELCEKVKI